MDPHVCVNENALGSESLGAVAGYGISVIEVAVLCRIEFESAAIIQSGGNAVSSDGFNVRKVSISYAKRLVRRGELDAITRCEFMCDNAINTDACESAWTVSSSFSIFLFHCEQILVRLDSGDGCVRPGLNFCLLASA